jgi:O-antigen ligase
MSRGGWMAFTAAFILMIILFIWKKDNLYSGEKERKVFITNLIIWVLILIVFSIPLLVKERAKTIVQIEKNQIGSEALSFRIPVWTNSLQMIKNQNYLGKGLGSFIYLYPAYNKEMPEVFMNAAHSDYLQIAIESGLPGVLSFLLIIIIFYITVISYLKYKGSDLSPFTRDLVKKDQLLMIGYTGAVTGLCLHGIGDFNFQIPANVIYFFMIMGLTVSIKSLTEKKELIEKKKIHSHNSFTLIYSLNCSFYNRKLTHSRTLF